MEMVRIGDFVVMLLIIAIVVTWLYYRFKRWLYAPSKLKLPFPEPAPFVRNEAVKLLEQFGYVVIGGKMKVPVTVELDDEPLESRLFVDYFARSDRELYVVKLSRQRQPMDWTASGIRERLMVYHYLYEETHGVLYVDLEQQSVRKVKFDIGQD